MCDEPSAPDAAAAPTPAPAPATPETPATPTPAPPLGEPDLEPGYSESGVPTFDSVREKIETRYGTSLGAAELDAETPQGRTVDEQYEARQRAAAERLAEIRDSMKSGQDEN